jgi:FKBP-type peptidyl-prolyl cis-trans isomerase 2
VANNSDYPKTSDFLMRESYEPLKVNVADQDSLPYRSVIPGFKEGVLGLKVDETIVVRIPPDKGYYNDLTHELHGKTLIFEITIVSIDS